MDISKTDNAELLKSDLRILTDEQRQQIYEQEKRRIADFTADGLTFSQTTLTIFCVAIYFLGCLLTTFGIPKAFLNFVIHRQWMYEPEYDFFGSLCSSLVGAAVELIMPVIALWVVVVPAALICGVWYLGADFIKFFKRLANKGKN